jgi:hypothetical protein
VPAAIAVAIPVLPIVAEDVVLLLHVPPDGLVLKVVVRPTQTVLLPVIAVGTGLTNTDLVAMQPVGSIYVMVGVPPATPVTTLLVPMVASAVLLLLHTPPVVVSLNVVVRPTHTVAIPVIGAGSGLTVSTRTELQPLPKV